MREEQDSRNIERKELFDIIYDKENQEEEKMEDKDLKRLGRKDLVDIIYEMKLQEEKLREEMEQRENSLRAELEETKAKLADREIRMENVGSIAEAALSLNDIFSTAQAAADDYLNAIKNAHEDSEHELEKAKDAAQMILAKAQDEADLQKKETDRICEEKLIETEDRVKRRWDQFQANVEKVLNAHAELNGLLARNNNHEE